MVISCPYIPCYYCNNYGRLMYTDISSGDCGAGDAASTGESSPSDGPWKTNWTHDHKKVLQLWQARKMALLQVPEGP